MASPGAAPAVEFDCIQIPANPRSRPPDCDNPDHPFHDPGWCDCLKTGLTSLRGGESAAFEQAIIEVSQQPTIGKHVLSVSGGTLDLSGLEVDDAIGQLLIDSPSGQAENFFLDFQMVVTGFDEGRADFDIIVRNTNATSIAILTYDPMDASHSSGLTYRGSVKSAGPGRGFQLSFEYAGEFLGGEPPPSPGPGACGPDPTGDALGVCTQRC